MKSEKIEMLETYIKCGISPIILEDFSIENLKNAVVLEANCRINMISGHYEGATFVAPDWFNKLQQNSKNRYCLLVVNNINKISKKEQLKFVELFKYKKIGTFELPKNCIIIATCSNLKENQMSEDLYSLCAHI